MKKFILILLALFGSNVAQAEVHYSTEVVQEKMLKEMQIQNDRLLEMIKILASLNATFTNVEFKLTELHDYIMPKIYNHNGEEIAWDPTYR